MGTVWLFPIASWPSRLPFQFLPFQYSLILVGRVLCLWFPSYIEYRHVVGTCEYRNRKVEIPCSAVWEGRYFPLAICFSPSFLPYSLLFPPLPSLPFYWDLFLGSQAVILYQRVETRRRRKKPRKIYKTTRLTFFISKIDFQHARSTRKVNVWTKYKVHHCLLLSYVHWMHKNFAVVPHKRKTMLKRHSLQKRSVGQPSQGLVSFPSFFPICITFDQRNTIIHL